MMIKLEIKNCNRTLLQYYLNRRVAKTVLSSGNIDNYEYFTGEEILPSDQSRMMEQAIFNSSLEKAFEKQAKTIEDQERK